jgi:hypothetical protein
MRGYPDYNFPAFNAAAADLRRHGYEVWSPAERDVDEDGFDPTKDQAKPLRYYMRFDLPAVLDSDLIAVLPGWEDSQGARLEVQVARECEIPVHGYPTMVPIPDEPTRHPNSARFHEVLRALGELHDRKQADYGRGDDPFANVRASSEWGVPAWVGAMIRATDKVRRLQTFAQHGTLENESALDSFDDLAVYAVIGRVLLEEETQAA